MRRLPVVLAVWWAWTPLIYALGWCLRFVTPGHRFAQSADQWFYGNFLTFGAALWIWLTVGFAGSAVIAAAAMRRGRPSKTAIRVAGVAAALLAAATFVQAWRVAWDDDKDYARYYAASTVFYAITVGGRRAAVARPAAARSTRRRRVRSAGSGGRAELPAGRHADWRRLGRAGFLVQRGGLRPVALIG
jgi:hypothetical protein